MGAGGQEDGDGVVEAVLTCQGDIDDPDFPDRCQKMFDRLSQVLNNSEYLHHPLQPPNPFLQKS